MGTGKSPLNGRYPFLLTAIMGRVTFPSADGPPGLTAGFLFPGEPYILDVGEHNGPLAQLAEQVTLNHPVPRSSRGRLTKQTE